MLQFLTRVFGSRNERIVRGYSKLVGQAGKFEAALQALSDEALGAKTAEFRERLKRRRHARLSCCPKPSPWSARQRGAR